MGTSVRPDDAIQGLDVEVRLQRGVCIRALVPSEILEVRFRSGNSPGAWIAAYRANSALIDAAIARRHQAKPGPVVVLRPEDFEPSSVPVSPS
jgi:hypothetical protein